MTQHQMTLETRELIYDYCVVHPSFTKADDMEHQTVTVIG